MHEIKFRAWHKADEKMYEVYGFAQNKWFLKGKQFPMPNGAVVIMQYTGLKDKNGKEIYEGDLLTDYGEAPPLYVEYSEKHGAYCFVDKFDPSGTVYYTPLMIYYEQMEVIGNIFQDGDLLRDS
ncbi:YopX family protein [Caldifermentibacillus hisashii]|uniref:YopX family protein n=1 Tax=Caldifermentibacillus hisashii TaxID=996558 RepID=UPI001C0F8D5A|nr:YopX family protein [Caldifermentibacillus hisashii]MBU5341251.1 YopX family protein [Caldifermentibacillus hisashii]